jgi:hemolysin III
MYLTALLWRMTRGDRTRQLSVACFGVSMIVLYAASGIYHAVPARFPVWVSVLRRLDHCAIYVLIAGTYTPSLALLLHGRLRVVLLCLVWATAAVGVACKLLLPWPPYELTVALYIAMGWMGMVAIAPLLRAVGVRGMAWSLLGGIFYMAGGVCDAESWPILWPGVIGPHEVLHVLDMIATLIHVYFIVAYVLPYRGKTFRLARLRLRQQGAPTCCC